MPAQLITSAQVARPVSSEHTPRLSAEPDSLDLELVPQYANSADRPLELVQLETRGLTPHSEAEACPSSTGGRPFLRRQPHPKAETEFWAARTAFKFSIAAKLREAGDHERADTLDDCHTRKTFAKCDDCGRAQSFLNRCDRNYCPECQPRLTRDRADSIAWWTKEIHQPKHVVLTARNSATITRERFLFLKSAFTKLRRRRCFANWQGGFYSIETTNEGRGWHVHIHALINTPWIDARLLAQVWAELVGQEFAIVKVKDAREQSYLKEVSKYVAKGNELASWSPHDLKSFLDSIEGLRMFGVFGSLYSLRTKFAEWIASLTDKGMECQCGSHSFSFLDENEFHASYCQATPITNPRPPPSNQIEMPLDIKQSGRPHHHGNL